jgi:putative ATP-dependent endonuclease of the OLD family
MFQVRRATFKRFRGISSGTLGFDKHTVLIGGNNCGKTAIVEGLALALGRDSVIPRVTDYDFFEGFFAAADPLAQQFTIRVVITGFEPNEISAHPEWFNFKNGTTPLWWDNDAGKLLDRAETEEVKSLPLAVEICCAGFYDDETCDYRVIRFFGGPAIVEPVDVEAVPPVPGSLLRQLGVYLLPSRRVWDDALTFSASSFTRVLREQHAIPENAIGELRRAVATAATPEGTDAHKSEFGQIVAAVQERLAGFGLLKKGSEQLKYRPTEMDARGLLESLVPHVVHENRYWIPLATQGDGVIALQNLLLLLEIGERRKGQNKGFILLMEEPELHIHPALQREIVALARGAADQTIVSTHSPFVAAAFSPSNVMVLKRQSFSIRSERLLPDTATAERKNLLKRYTHQERLDFLEAVMGATVIVPEGEYDAEWLRWMKSLASVAPSVSSTSGLGTISVLRTKYGQFKTSIQELRRLNVDVVALTDGDAAGLEHALEAVIAGARLILRWPDGWECEDVVARILEPALETLRTLGSPFDTAQTCSAVRAILLSHKRDAQIRQQAMDAAFEVEACAERAASIVGDLVSFAHGERPTSLSWQTSNGIEVLDPF